MIGLICSVCWGACLGPALLLWVPSSQYNFCFHWIQLCTQFKRKIILQDFTNAQVPCPTLPSYFSFFLKLLALLILACASLSSLPRYLRCYVDSTVEDGGLTPTHHIPPWLGFNGCQSTCYMESCWWLSHVVFQDRLVSGSRDLGFRSDLSSPLVLSLP